MLVLIYMIIDYVVVLLALPQVSTGILSLFPMI